MGGARYKSRRYKSIELPAVIREGGTLPGGERGTLCRPVVGRAYLARWDYLPCELACRSVRRVGVRIANLRTFSHSSSLFTHPTATFIDKLLSWTSRAIDVIPPFQRRLASAVVCNHHEAMMMMSIINHHRHHEV